MPETRTHYRTCPLCEAMCGIAVEIEGDAVKQIRGDADDPFSRGHICPKAPALKGLHEDPDRLRTPQIREAEGWRPASWAEALDAAAAGLHAVQQRHGTSSVGIYLGNPNVHNLGSMLFMPQLVRALKTKHRYSATSADQLPHMFASYLMFGHQLLVPIPDLDRTDFFVILGGNPLASNGSLMSVPDVKKRLKAVQQRGGQFVVIDPRRTETAGMADQHIFIRPESDAILLLAMLNAVFANNWERPGDVLEYSDGIEILRQITYEFTPERAEAATGIPAGEITQLAEQLATTDRAALYGRIGASTQSFGGLCHWLINALNIVCGNFDRPGGVMFTTPAVDGIGAAGGFAIGNGSFGRWRSSVRNLPEFGGELPVATMADEMLDAEPAQRVHGFISVAGNPVLSTPNGARLEEALGQLEFMVSVDFYLNETTRHANVILPPTSPLERSHYDLAFHLLAIRNTAKYAPAALSKPKDAKHDWEIAIELMARLEKLRGTNTVAVATKKRALLAAGPETLLSLALLVGPYGPKAQPFKPLTLGKLKRHPHGIDLGPLQQQMPHRLQTANHRVQLAPQEMLRDLDRLRDALNQTDPGTYRLIGRRHIRSNNSWMHNIEGLMTGKDRSKLQMCSRDAKQLGVAAGDDVQISSAAGKLTVAVEVNDDLMPGVVSLPHGFGHHRPGIRQQTATAHAGVSINDLTDHMRVDALTGNAAFNGTPVDIQPR